MQEEGKLSPCPVPDKQLRVVLLLMMMVVVLVALMMTISWLVMVLLS